MLETIKCLRHGALLVLLLSVAVPGSTAARPSAPDRSVRRHHMVPAGRSRRAKRHAHRSLVRRRARHHRARRFEDHEVLPGETLGGIAYLYGVKVADLRRWNHLHGSSIRAGHTLKVHPAAASRRRMSYHVRPGDTLLKISRHFDFPVKQIRHLNRLKSNRIRAGHDLVIYAHKNHVEGVALGQPAHGKLLGGRPMPRGRGYVVRNRSETYGASSTIAHLLRAIERVRRQDSRMPPIVVGDISTKHGGYFPPHKSHQNGLDVDLGYIPRRRANYGHFFRANLKTLDARRTLHFIKALVRGGNVRVIFMSYSVQRVVYAYARKHMSKRALLALLQYPRHRTHRVGLIRDSKGHVDHFHVRFFPAHHRIATR